MPAPSTEIEIVSPNNAECSIVRNHNFIVAQKPETFSPQMPRNKEPSGYCNKCTEIMQLASPPTRSKADEVRLLKNFSRRALNTSKRGHWTITLLATRCSASPF